MLPDRKESVKRQFQWILVAVIWSGAVFLLGYWSALTFPKPAVLLKGPPGSAQMFGPEYFASMKAKYEAHLSDTTPTDGQAPANEPADGGAAAAPEAVVVSKNGSKYYPKGCKAADRIPAQVRVYFASAAAAEAAGYTKATTCK